MKEERTTGTKSQTRRSTSGTRSTSAVHNTKVSSAARSAQAAGDRRSTGRRNAAYRRKRKRRLIRRYVTLFSVLIIFASVIFFTAAAMRNASPIDIVLKAAKLEMKQEQEIPSLTAEVQVGGKKEKVLKKVLDRKHNYTVADFVEELESGKGYEVVCKADGTVEGEFDIKINLTEDMKKKLERKYMKRVNVSVKEGKLVVQNKYGTWEEDKFKLYDGTYVKSNFMQSKGSTYYFGEDEKKVIGWQEIESYKYYFDEEGKMLTGWQKIEDATYYLGEDGKAHVSWLELDGNKYCFDKDGKMLTGEQQVGIKKCVFAEDGKLESEESSIDPSKPMVALTFDDGPGKRTMELLEAFEEHGARATFFMVGSNIPNYPDAIKKMEEIGCEIGNHTNTHANLTKLDAAGINNEIGTVDQLLADIIGRGATVIRPPWGEKNDTVKSTVQNPLIMWSIDTLDWKTRNAESTISTVMNNVGDGDIILMHDIHTQSVDAAIQLIPKLQAAGYQLVTVSELAQSRNINMEKGGVYSQFWKE